eukprot:CAMPEP_0178486826 /NCGR_PEP_ID=MMETSP0696-20121128/9005_1 /TAXON_ID=265572 /ORGANISM="Extubocellulus spinifer, Strain CCMP396" /LENGTH=131 /DNA_ID=CAMNT_0020114497 /DNA_START=77 /DNA_END=473 /DNA_ORIENTATION=-
MTLPPQANTAPSQRPPMFPSFTTQYQRHNMDQSYDPFKLAFAITFSSSQYLNDAADPTSLRKEYNRIGLNTPMTTNDIKRRPTPSRDPGDEDDDDADSNSPAPSTTRLHSVRTAARGNVAGIKYLIHRRFE